MQGASGSFQISTTNKNLGTSTLTVEWVQNYTPGGNGSGVTIHATLQRMYDTSGAAGGKWYASTTAGITVDGKQAGGWTKSQEAMFTNPGDIGWEATGTVTIDSTAEKSVEIKVAHVLWENGDYYDSSISVPETTRTIALKANPRAHTLTASAGTGATLEVNRTSSPNAGAATGAISSGATIYDGDTLKITAGAATGYDFTGLTVNGAAFYSGESTTVSGDVSASATASVKIFSLSLQPGTGTTLSCYRTASPKGGASAGWLGNGATLYHGDTITITGSANDGYTFGGVTVNGSAYQNGAPMEVTDAVTVKSSATVQQFRLSISAGKGLNLTVSRLSSPKAGAAAGELSDGTAIFHGDTLQITATTESGYALNTLTVNGNSINNGAAITVTGNVTVAATAKEQGLAYIGNEKYIVYIGGSGAYQQYQPYIGAADGSKWELQS